MKIADPFRRAAAPLAGVLCLFAFVLAGSPRPATGEEFKPDIAEVVRETQRTPQAYGASTLVWWIPTEFWRVSFAQGANMTERQIAEFEKVMDPYTFVVVADGQIGPFGGATFKSEAAIRPSLRFVDGGKKERKPINTDEISPDVRNFIGMMKPVLAGILGSMGENMHFFLFPATGADGKKLADPKAEGSFSVKMGKQEFKWNLPLSSLFPKKTCKKCGVALIMAYNFCPYDGSELPKREVSTPKK